MFTSSGCLIQYQGQIKAGSDGRTKVVMYGCHGKKGGVAEEIFTSGVLVFLCVVCVS